MSTDPRHLIAGENPPSSTTQQLADTMSSWTDARIYPLPAGPASLVPTAAENASLSSTPFNPATHGALWQRFANTFGLELDIVHRAIDDALADGFLELPGKTRTSLDTTWKIQLPSANTTVTAVAANDNAIYASAGVGLNGKPILDPNRGTSVQLQAVTRLFDFYYGLAQEATIAATGASSYPLPSRVGANSDGSYQVEWVTVNGTTVTNWTISADRRSINFTSPLTAGSTIVVHFTTYDIYFIVADALPVLFLRSPYFELFLTTSGTPPATNGTATVAPGVSVVTPQLDMLWNELDEIALYLGKSRGNGETNALFARRLTDTILYPQDATPVGLRNALAAELGLVSHLNWGPGGTATASTLSLGSQVYADSILVDRLPLPYYSVKTTANQTGTIPLAVPALAPGQSKTFTLQLCATRGAVIPGQVPLQFASTLPSSQMPIFDQLGDADKGAATAFHRPISSFSAPTRPWYRGSLCVWKNGTPLVAGTDFTEFSTTRFTLASPVVPGDVLQLGYIYDDSEHVPQLQAQAEIDTELVPVVRISAKYKADATLATAQRFTGWKDLPPNTDPATVPTNGTWTLTLEATNSGSSQSSAFTLSVILPPQITFDGTFITSSDVTKLRALSYIDGAQVWVKNLTDASLRALLYDTEGRATALLKGFASDINAASPLEWGQIRWDQTIWHTINEKYDEFGFIPHLLDPQYQSQLKSERIRYAGRLAADGRQGKFGETFIDFSQPGTALGVSSAVRYPDFVSGIGDGDDLKLSIATPDQITLSNSQVPLQRTLSGTQVTPVFAIPKNQTDAWWAAVAPGAYFLNQEAHTYFSQPLYAELTGTSLVLPGISASTSIVAQVYDPALGLIPMRRVSFVDALGNASLFTTDVLVGTGGTQYELSYPDFIGAITGAASDGNTYTVSVTSTALLSAPPPTVVQVHSSTTSTASFVMNGSFITPPTVGNTMVAYTASDGFMATAPAGWTELAITPQPNDLRIFVKRVVANDPSIYNFAQGAGQATWGVVTMVELAGVGSLSQIAFSQDTYAQGNVSPLSSSSSLTIPSAGGLLLSAHTAAVFGGGTTTLSETPPAGQTVTVLARVGEPVEEFLLLHQVTSEPYTASQPWTDTGLLSWTSGLYSTFGGALVWFPPAAPTAVVTHAPGAGASNMIAVSPALPAGVTLPVTYALNRSFTVVDQNGGAAVYVDQPQPSGILVTYEGGTGSNVTDLPLHPYYNPRTSGFVYLSSDFYLPSSISVRVDPQTVPADNTTSYNVRVAVRDAYGAGTQGLPVNVLVGYREGALSYQGTTDVFGIVDIDVPAAPSVQIATVTATMQLSDHTGTPVALLLDRTYIEMFSPYA